MFGIYSAGERNTGIAYNWLFRKTLICVKSRIGNQRHKCEITVYIIKREKQGLYFAHSCRLNVTLMECDQSPL